MKIDVYSTSNCMYCTMAKNLLASKGLAYTEHVIGLNLEKTDFQKMFPDIRMVPYILVDNQPIGGYNELMEAVRTDSLGKQLLVD